MHVVTRVSVTSCLITYGVHLVYTIISALLVVSDSASRFASESFHVEMKAVACATHGRVVDKSICVRVPEAFPTSLEDKNLSDN